ncbi:hypothetical protein FQN52_004352 [Onygenales sp. PD_12]|nr:hypothetical protein FQN53_004380 [Emmonsiellopsis sp. PD_33]KAK2791910.1 hypothetical protein FQN52_004352 [Onygenales sp. PD_12]
MHSSLALVFGLLATSISALPTAPIITARDVTHVTVQLTNDQTGLSSSKAIPLDYVKRPIIEVFAGTPIITEGDAFASSTQLTDFVADVRCEFVGIYDDVLVELTDRATFADLDGNPDAATPITLKNYRIACAKTTD